MSEATPGQVSCRGIAAAEQLSEQERDSNRDETEVRAASGGSIVVLWP